MSAEAPTLRADRLPVRDPYWRRRQLPVALAWLFMLLLFAVACLLQDGFAGTRNVEGIIEAGLILGTAAIGQTLVIITGGIDLTVPSLIGLAGVLLTRWQETKGTLVALVLILAIACAVGALNGIAVGVFKAPAIIVTLAMSSIVLGALLVITKGGFAGGQSVDQSVRDVATGEILGLPSALVVWGVLAIAVSLVLARTSFGRCLYAIGNNPVATRMAGIRVPAVLLVVYVISACTAAIAGVLLTGFLGQAFAYMGADYLFTSIAVVLIGGASILGGSGNYAGTVAGTLLVGTLISLLTLLDIGPAYLRILYGLLILATVGLGTMLSRRAAT